MLATHPPTYISLARPPSTMAEEVRAGLTGSHKRLPCKYFYDARGQELFERICELPEYYLTRTEAAILQDQARAILDLCPFRLALVELGSGSCRKTRYLIEPLLERQDELVYQALDIAPDAMARAATQLSQAYARLRFVGLVGEFGEGLSHLAHQDGPPRLVVFLGSTIGNFDEEEIARFFTMLRARLRPQDRFLLGFDVRKDPAILIPAYDDAQGITAAFNRNLLARINEELAADFDPRAFGHRAIFNDQRSRIEMHLVSQKAQKVRLAKLGWQISFREGETIHTENCYKHSEAAMQALLAKHGFRVLGSFADANRWFCLYLLA